ncbi:MAG TPA: site-2 protease family protein [Aeromicrobium sp.]|nr:site-2 protease family protein [Aeromicrobium sp.]
MIFALGVLAFAVGIVLSIALHEVGHMVPAKLFKVKVTQFFVGFGNTLWSFRRGETEYGIKAIPLGGYVRLVGMLPPAKDADPHEVRPSNTGLFTQLAEEARVAEYEHVSDEDLPRMFYRLPTWKKIVVMVGGPFMNVVIATVLFAIVIMGFGVNQATTTVASVSDCAISDAEVGRTCTDDDPVAPARLAGLEPGDTITSIDGEAITSWEQMTRLIRANGDEPIRLGYERAGVAHTVTVTPSVVTRADLDDPQTAVNVGFLGVGPTEELQAGGVGDVVDTLGFYVEATAEAIVHLPVRMIDVAKAAFGGERDVDSPIGVVGASRLSGELVTYDDPSFAEGTARVLTLLAGLNMFLALFNLIPLLPFDGGHIAGALWEAIRRGWSRLRSRPDPGFVDVAKALPVSYAVGGVLVVMSVILLYVDIVNPVRIS